MLSTNKILRSDDTLTTQRHFVYVQEQCQIKTLYT